MTAAATGRTGLRWPSAARWARRRARPSRGRRSRRRRPTRAVPIRWRCSPLRTRRASGTSCRYRHGRMSQSPFAFYRGTAAIMAADLASTPEHRPPGCRPVVTPTSRTSAPTPLRAANSSSTRTTSTRRCPGLGSGTSSVSWRASSSRDAATASPAPRPATPRSRPRARIGSTCASTPRCATWRSGTRASRPTTSWRLCGPPATSRRSARRSCAKATKAAAAAKAAAAEAATSTKDAL